MEGEQFLELSPLYTTPKSHVAVKWLKKFSEKSLTHVDFREHWKLWVTRAFSPESIPGCIEWNIKEEIFQQQLIDPLEEFICHGDPSVILNHLCDSVSTPSVCGKVFKMGEPTYNCRDCRMDPTCVLCLECFKLSEHKTHRYKMGTSTGGGCCDCGDVEAWKSNPYCGTHAQGLKKKEENRIAKFPMDLNNRVHCAFDAILQYAFQVLTLEYSPGLPSDLRLKEDDVDDPICIQDSDLYCTVLYNDETHTFEQVINTLARVIQCSHRDAIEFVTNIDREGRAVVKSSTFQHCTELKVEIERFTSRHGTRPLKVLVVHAFVVAHQMHALKLLSWLRKIVGLAEDFRKIFSDVVLYTGTSGSIIEGILLKDSLLWKSARVHWHRLVISGMFIEYENKKAFAKVFTKNYGSVLKDFIRDDHDYGFSVASLSIQVFPVPTIAQYLMACEDILLILLNTFMSECSRKCNRIGKLEFDRTTPAGPFKRATFILYDIRYLLGTPPTKWTDDLRKGFLQGVSLIHTLFTYMEGMDSVTRQVGQHMEYEPEWESAFNLHIKLAPVITLLINWCSTDRIVLTKAYRLTLKKLHANPSFDPNSSGIVREVANHSATCIQYDVSTQPVSIHLPLTRFLAGLHLHLEKYDLSFDAQEFFPLNKPTPVQIIEPVLRTQVMIAQVHAGMWRRNGYSLSNQIFFYHNVKCRGEMLDKDIVLLQMGASLIESNKFMIHLLNKFGLCNWASEYIYCCKHAEEETLKQTINMVEEFLSLLIVIIGERYVAGVGKVTQDDCIKNEIMHQLFIHPLSHSEINKTLPDVPHENHETGMDRVIDEVATYTKQMSGKGMYVIKPELLDKYNGFFYHYTKEEMSKSEEEQRKLRKEKTGYECCPPPVLPAFTEPFSNVAALLQCDVMLHIMKLVLKRSTNLRARNFSEAQLHKVLHLIGYALNEEEQKYSKFFKFTARGEKWGLESALEELTTTPRVVVHRDLINFILQKYRQVANKNVVVSAPVTSGTETAHGSGSISKQENLEKENRAKLAAERRAKIMAEITMQQKTFMKENPEMFSCAQTSDQIGVETSDIDMPSPSCSKKRPIVCLGPNKTPRNEVYKNSVLICIICQEHEEVKYDGPPMVLAAFVQKSSVLSRNRKSNEGSVSVDSESISGCYLDSNLGPAPHASTCGHVMHYNCWSEYIEGILTKENRRPYRLRQPTSYDIERNEFLCPLCYCLSNTIIPVIPNLSSIVKCQSKQLVEEKVPFNSWYEASLLAIKHKRRVDGSSLDSEPVGETFPHVETSLEASSDSDMFDISDDFQNPIVGEALESPIYDDLTMTDEEIVAFLDSSTDEMSVRPLNYVALKEGDIYMKLKIFLGKSAPKQQASSQAQSEISFDLLQMIQLFAEMAYTKGLDLDPGEEDDPIVPMMAWKCCAYTVHATECFLRYTKKPLLGDFTSRQQDGLENLIKLSGLLGTVWKKKYFANKLGVKLLMMIMDNQVTDESLIEWDCFGLLVPLTGTLPSIFYADNLLIPTGSLLDLHNITLLLIANMAQTILLSDLTEMCFTEETNEDTECLQDLVPLLRPIVTVLNTIALWEMMKKSSISFLRSSTIFYHFLTGVPAPPELKEYGGDTYGNMCTYLGLPTTCKELLCDSSVGSLFSSWAEHPKVMDLSGNHTQIRDMNPINELVILPDDYSDLLNTVSLFTCPNSDREDSRNPTMCLICGEMLCSQTYCCQTELNKILVGACTYHSHSCGAGAGIFLRVRECEILLLASPSRGCFLAPPYLDDYGEPDQGLRRGNPLHLDEEKYKRLQMMWLTHSIHEEIARALDTTSPQMPTQWQHL